MPLLNLRSVSEQLPEVWKSRVVASIGTANVKVVRMDGSSAAEEIHDYHEGLLVLDGQLCLEVEGESLTVEAGNLYVAEAGVPHTVLPGSHGTLIIIDL